MRNYTICVLLLAACAGTENSIQDMTPSNAPARGAQSPASTSPGESASTKGSTEDENGPTVVSIGPFDRVAFSTPVSFMYIERERGVAEVRIAFNVNVASGDGVHLQFRYEPQQGPVELTDEMLSMTVDGENWLADSGQVVADIHDSTGKLMLTEVRLSSGSEAMGPLDGTIEGPVAKTCFPLPPAAKGAPVNSAGEQAKPVPMADASWSSEFCRAFAH